MDTTVSSLDIIRHYNPANKLQGIVPEQHEINVIGLPVTDQNGQVTRYRFKQTSNPSAAAKEAGVEASDYLRCYFKRCKDLTLRPKLANAPAMGMVISGNKKPQAHNVFANTQSELYEQIMYMLQLGEGEGYEEVGKFDMLVKGKKVRCLKVRLFATVLGSIVSINFPTFKLQQVVNGKRRDWVGAKYDPEQDRYVADHVRTNNVIKVFCDEDDLANLEGVAVKMFENQVKPYMVDKKITITETATGVTTKVEQPAVDPDEPDVDPIKDLNTDGLGDDAADI